MKCPWSQNHPLLERYHDLEWGTPVHDDRKHFEFFVMDLFQAGLSWLTILKKREGFCEAFESYDIQRIARFDEENVSRLLANERIIRNRLKINATIHNAGKFLEVINEYGSFDNYIWQFTGSKILHNAYTDQNDLPPRTELSDRISTDLKKRGFKFVGSTIIYAYMQAAGLVNDHVVSCFRYKELTGEGT